MSSCANKVLRLSCKRARIGLDAFKTLAGVCARNIFDLVCLLADNSVCVGNVLVDKLLVRDVDQRRKEDDACGNESQAPEWNDLEEPVGRESRSASLRIMMSSSQKKLKT